MLTHWDGYERVTYSLLGHLADDGISIGGAPADDHRGAPVNQGQRDEPAAQEHLCVRWWKRSSGRAHEVYVCSSLIPTAPKFGLRIAC